MQVTTRAIVLSSLKYGDNARIVKIYTQDHGLVSCIVRGMYSKKKSKAALYQPLQRLSITLNLRDDRDLQSIKEAELAALDHALLTDPIRSSTAMFIAELFQACLEEGEVFEELFAFLEDVVEELGSQPDISHLPLHVMLELAELLGIYPDLGSEGQILDMREGVFVNSLPLHKEVIDGAAVGYLKTQHGIGFVATEARLDRTDRRDLMDKLLMYFKIHLPHFKEIRSYPVLKVIM